MKPKSVTGQYNKKITFRIPTVEIDGEMQYTDGATIWAAAEPLRGREFWEAQTVQSESLLRFKIRYIAGVKPDWQIRMEGADYAITNISDPGMRHRELWILAKVVE